MMNRPVENAAIGAVMADWQLNRILAGATGRQAFYTLLLASGWTRAEIASHRGQTNSAVSEQLRNLLKKIKIDSDSV